MIRVAITGMGAVTPVGNDAPTTWGSLKAGKSGIGPITTFDTTTYPVKIAGMVKGFDPRERLPDPHRARHLHRAASFAVAAGAEALREAGIPEGTYDPHER